MSEAVEDYYKYLSDITELASDIKKFDLEIKRINELSQDNIL